jgi:predicted component of type VI protein secretion system
VAQALQTLRRVRNAFAHSTTTATLTDPSHADRLAQAYGAARANALWQPLERILQEQVGGDGSPLDPALKDYILLITILVAFLEAAAQQLSPQPPAVVMGFTGIHVPPLQSPGRL